MAAYTPGGTYRNFMSVKNSGARTFSGFSLTNGMQTGGGADTVQWDTGYYVDYANIGFEVGETSTGNAFLARATSRNATTKRPCYTIVGGSLSGGLCGDYDTGILNLGIETNPAGQYAKITIDHSSPSDGKDLITAVGHFTIDGGRAGSNGPVFTTKAANQYTV